MERDEIECFLLLSEELHFGRTAERMHLSRARVSQLIQCLERRVGAPLFIRTSRRVALTPVGEQLRSDLYPAHQQTRRALARAVSAVRGITGPLRIGYSSPMTAHVLLSLAERFRTCHPDCEIGIQEVQLSDPYGPIRRGRIHLQVTELPVEEPDLAVGPVLSSEHRVLMVPAHHPLARRESVSLEDLADTTLLTISDATVPEYFLNHHFPRHTPSGRSVPQLHAGTYWTEILNLVGAGQGVAPASAGSERYYSRPDIAWVPFRDAPPVEYGLVWPASCEHAGVHAFIELCATSQQRS
ncbi:LysR family transcriptional regulator [Streptomyces sp. NPDC055103]